MIQSTVHLEKHKKTYLVDEIVHGSRVKRTFKELKHYVEQRLVINGHLQIFEISSRDKGNENLTI